MWRFWRFDPIHYRFVFVVIAAALVSCALPGPVPGEAPRAFVLLGWEDEVGNGTSKELEKLILDGDRVIVTRWPAPRFTHRSGGGNSPRHIFFRGVEMCQQNTCHTLRWVRW